MNIRNIYMSCIGIDMKCKECGKSMKRLSFEDMDGNRVYYWGHRYSFDEVCNDMNICHETIHIGTERNPDKD